MCSGIEAASVAWKDLGWEAIGFSEIEPFPSAVLAHHFPEVPNHGDMQGFRDWPIKRGTVDLLVGGTPCQSFSIAGLRGGLADARGSLALTYLQLADHYRPRWIVWENVPGVLSSNGGRDFGSFLGGLAHIGYQFSWRVLDAQYFGVPQRRRRVFVVGHCGDWRSAAEVLFERESVHRDLAAGSEKGKDAAGGIQECSGAREWPKRIAPTLNAAFGKKLGLEDQHALGGAGLFIPDPQRLSVRRLTLRECERLQGFPDDWTAVPYRGKTAPDGPRYKAIGNSMAVPVMKWIGERIAKVERERV